MSLLRADKLAMIDAHVKRVEERFDTAVRTAQYGQDGSGTPPGMKAVSTPEERQTWMRFLETQARREREGFAPGDVATAATQHPAVREVLTEELDAAP